MQVKTYSGPNSKHVLDQIKAELGLDAVILETRNGRENGQNVVRMTAALDRDAPSPRNDENRNGNGSGHDADKRACLSPRQGAARYADPLSAPMDLGRLDLSPSNPTGRNIPRQIEEEWISIKKHIFALMKPAIRLDQLSPQQRITLEYLQKEGVADGILLDLYHELLPEPGLSALEPLSRLVQVRAWGYANWRQRIHLVTGPYGSGKTTAAVRMALFLQKSSPTARLCLVNADAERGSGRLLLKHYAGLSDFPYREVSSPMDMAGVVAEIRSQGFDRVIVDLPALGKGGTLAGVLSSLGLNQGGYDAMACHLVLPPHYDQAALGRLLPRYTLNMEGSIIWSKLDEADAYASLLNTAAVTRLPASCLSFGPSLRGTLIPADSSAIWRLIFKHELPSFSNASNGADKYE